MTGLDTHVHVWDPGHLDYPWLTGLARLDEPCLPDDYRAAGGAERAIFVQADPRPEQALDEARWVASLGWPELAGIVAGADLRSSRLDEHLDALAEVGGVVGIRHILQGEDVRRLADPALRAGVRVLAARGLTFDACVRHEQLAALGDLVADVPGLRFVVDHVGKPPMSEGLSSEAGHRWASAMQRLAASPSAHIKLSGLPAETGDAQAFDSHADDFLRVALDLFGPQRAMIGSDWPVSARLGVGAAPGAWAERVRSSLALDGPDWRAVSTTSGARFYGLPFHDPTSEGEEP